MTESNFNLSEKIFYEKEWNSPNSINTEDVKEFIKRLKDKLKYNLVEKEHFISLTETAFIRDVEIEIDKLAGEKLVEAKGE